MALKPGSNDPESPAGNDAEEVDREIENPDADTQPAGEASPEAQDTPPAEQVDAEVAKVEDEPADPPKGAAAKPKPKEAKPTPVDEAIAHLTTPPKAADAEQPGARKATDPAAAKPKDGEQEPEKPATGDGQPNDDADDPISTWSPEERKNTKGKVKDRFRALHKQAEELKPHAEIGREWAGFVKEQNLSQDLNDLPDEGVSVAIRTQAATRRVALAARAGRAVPESDLRLLMKNREAIDAVLGLAGHAPEAPAADHSKVVISQEVRDLQALSGTFKDEDELRAVQAALDAIRGKKAAPAERAGDEMTPAREREERRQAPTAPSVPWTAEDVRLAQVGMEDDMVAAGVKREQTRAHFTANLLPLVTAKVASLYPGKDPDEVWGRISPANRRELVKQAQSQWSARQKPPQPARPPRAPTPAPVQGTGSRPALQRAVPQGKGAVAAAIRHMTGGESD